MTDDECSALPCFVDNRQVVSCWQFSPEEVAEIVRTGRIYLGVLGASTPPVWVTGTNPFTYPDQPNDIIGSTQA